MATQTVGEISLTNQLVEAASSFSELMNRRMIKRSRWFTLIDRETWPDDEAGDTLHSITYERTMPNGPQLWSPINSDDTSTKFAVPDATKIGIAQTIRRFGLHHTAIESVPLTVNDVRFGTRKQKQLAAVFDNLTENVQRIWEIRFRDEYRRLCGTKYVVGYQNVGTTKLYASFGDDYPTDITSAGVGILTQAFLDRIRFPLLHDGAGDEAMAYQNGRAMLTVIAGPDALDGVIRMNPEIREDFRQSSRVDELLQSWGADRPYKGFMHLADEMSPRYNYVEQAATATPFSGVTSITVTAWNAATGVGQLTIAKGTGNDFSVIKPGMNFEVYTGATSTIKRAKIIDISSTNLVATFIAESVTGFTTSLVLTPANFKQRDRTWSNDIAQGFHEVPFYCPGGADSANVTLNITGGPTHGRASGTRWVPNPAYQDAAFEEGFIYHRKVYRTLIPNPFSGAGSGTKFAAKSYTGKFDFLNIQHRVENPDNSWGYFRAVMASGAEPLKPYWGVAFIYRRYEQPGAVIPAPVYGQLSAGYGVINPDASGWSADGSAQD